MISSSIQNCIFYRSSMCFNSAHIINPKLDAIEQDFLQEKTLQQPLQHMQTICCFPENSNRMVYRNIFSTERCDKPPKKIELNTWKTVYNINTICTANMDHLNLQQSKVGD